VGEADGRLGVGASLIAAAVDGEDGDLGRVFGDGHWDVPRLW
jgi:hypothetical protein